MKPLCSENRSHGMTLVEAVVVIFVTGLVILVLLPGLRGRTTKYRPITCSNNLKQLAIALKVWEGDHNDKFPMGLSVTNGGTKELMEMAEAWRAFQVMSNEIATPKILLCPQDSTRMNLTRDFGAGLENKISYFIGLIPDDNDPQSILSGDDNFRLNNLPVSKGTFNISSNSDVEWDASRHFLETKHGWFEEGFKTNYGYLMYADGSVGSATSSGFKNSVQQNYLGTSSRIAVP